MKLWRIATATRSYGADDLSGTGASKYPGRWNADGEKVVYTASSAALAVLETAAHIETGGLPLNRFVVEVEVPARVWTRRRTLDVARLDPSWQAIPAGAVSVAAGSAWLRSRNSALLVVPSAIVPEESVVLINPAHADARLIKAKIIRRYEYDRLFRNTASKR